MSKHKKHGKPKQLENVPKLLVIGNQTYHVIFCKKLRPKVLGMCDQENKVIYITLEQDPFEMVATVLHEALHAIECEFNVPLGHPKIRKLEYGLAQLFLQILAPQTKDG